MRFDPYDQGLKIKVKKPTLDGYRGNRNKTECEERFEELFKNMGQFPLKTESIMSRIDSKLLELCTKRPTLDEYRALRNPIIDYDNL